jgi:hypothetical protein
MTLDFQVGGPTDVLLNLTGNHDVFTSLANQAMVGKGHRVAPERSIFVPKLFFGCISTFQNVMERWTRTK